MPPHEGLVHLKEYDIKDSNVELIGSDLDHKVKYVISYIKVGRLHLRSQTKTFSISLMFFYYNFV